MEYSKWTVRSLLIAVVVGGLIACDSNDDDDGVPTVPQKGVPTHVSITVFGIPALEGLLTDETDGKVEQRSFKTLVPVAGLEYGPRQGRLVIARGIFAFDLFRIPDGSTIHSARLNLFQSGTTGAPYEFMERLLVDHIDTSSFLDLHSDLFDGFTLSENIGVISEDPVVEFKILDVTQQVQSDVDAGRDTASFRIRGEKEQLFRLEGLDEAVFTDSLDEAGFIPSLDIVYEKP